MLQKRKEPVKGSLFFFVIFTPHFMERFNERRIEMGLHKNKYLEGYVDLANAIIKQAADDYQQALCFGNNKVIKECKQFFNSSYYKTLTSLDGSYLMDLLEKEAMELNYDWEKIAKSHNLTTK